MNADLSGWLACPHCRQDLESVAPLTLRCASGHSFDVNKRGYVNLVPSTDRMIGDTAAMLDARDAFLGAGHYAPILNALSAAVPADAARIIDAGCGTGHYLAGVLAGRDTASAALAFDLSPEAVRRAVRTTGAAGLVADTWAPLPIRDATADALITVFAPRNLPEFHRVLRQDGTLVVVVPSADHLRELRADGRALDVPADKAERLQSDAGALFDPLGVERVQYRMHLSPADVEALLGMGPSAHHRAGDSPTTAEAVTVSVDVVRLQRR
ncbi:MAG: putative RNA methyltransferase [Leifsonia sp.]